MPLCNDAERKKEEEKRNLFHTCMQENDVA
jgi:hypothetical protein